MLAGSSSLSTMAQDGRYSHASSREAVDDVESVGESIVDAPGGSPVTAATTGRMGRGRLVTVALAALIALAASLVTLAAPASASEQAALAALALEEELLYLHNQTRRQIGVRPLDGWTDIRDVNRTWSRELARTPDLDLRHNPNRGDQLCCWTVLAENVGRASMNGLTSDAVRDAARRAMDGWRNSPGHWESLSNPDWRHMGIGVAVIPWDGHPGRYRAFITVGFRTPNGATNPASIHYPSDSGPPTHSLDPQPKPAPTPEPTPAPVQSSLPAPPADEPEPATHGHNDDPAPSGQGAPTSLLSPGAEAALWALLPEGERDPGEDPSPVALPARGHTAPAAIESEAAVLGDIGALVHAGATPEPVDRAVLAALAGALLAYTAHQHLQRITRRASTG